MTKEPKQTKKKRVNWLAVKAEFISDPTLTYAAIAVKYGVSVSSIKRQAAVGSWRAERAKIDKQVTETIAAKAVDELTEVNERHTKAYKNLQAFALTNLNILYDHIKAQVNEAKLKGEKLDPKNVYSSQMAKFLAETLRIAMDGERITLGLPTVVTKGEQDVKLSSEFADQPLEELEKLYKAVDNANDEANAGTSTKS